MFNTDMRERNYFIIGEPNEYGQASIPSIDAQPHGIIKMAIYTSGQAVTADARFKDCTYIGLTNAEIIDKYIIQYEQERLKVIYVNKAGRYTQVFLKNI